MARKQEVTQLLNISIIIIKLYFSQVQQHRFMITSTLYSALAQHHNLLI